MTGNIPERMGNAHPSFAPHNVYQCWGVDRWLAIEIHTDDEFAVLAKIIGQPNLSDDPKFNDMASRKTHEKDLDAIIEAWTRERDRDWMAETLTLAGLMAAPSREGRDIYADPHLKDRDSFMHIRHPELGDLDLIAPPWKFSNFKIPKNHAPLLGEHNDYVLGELLGLSEMEINKLREEDIISR